MASPIQDLGSYLIANAPSDTPLVEGTNLYYGMIPEGVAEPCAALMDGAGTSPQSFLGVSDINRPGVQVMVRGALGGYKEAYDLSSTVADLLHEIANTTIGGTKYIQVRKMNEPGCIGFDEKNRPVFTCHLAIMRSE